jgi:hypothetical protein
MTAGAHKRKAKNLLLIKLKIEKQHRPGKPQRVQLRQQLNLLRKVNLPVQQQGQLLHKITIRMQQGPGLNLPAIRMQQGLGQNLPAIRKPPEQLLNQIIIMLQGPEQPNLQGPALQIDLQTAVIQAIHPE